MILDLEGILVRGGEIIANGQLKEFCGALLILVARPFSYVKHSVETWYSATDGASVAISFCTVRRPFQ